MFDRAAWIVTLVLVVGASALLVGSVGSTVAQTDGPATNQTTETVTSVEAHEGPNGRYATVTDTNEIELRFDRVTPTFTSTYREVFTVTVPESGAVWVEHDVPGVTFSLDESGTELGADDPVALEAGETVSVGVQIDAAAIEPGTESFTVVAVHANDADNRELPSPETALMGAPLGAGLFGLLSVARRKI